MVDFAKHMYYAMHPNDVDGLSSSLDETNTVRSALFDKLYKCLLTMHAQYPNEYPRLITWKNTVDTIQNKCLNKRLNMYDAEIEEMQATLSVLDVIRLYPNGQPFPDAVMLAYVFITVYHEYAVLSEKLNTLQPENAKRLKLRLGGKNSAANLLLHKIYWKKELGKLNANIFGKISENARAKYAFGLCGVVKELWFQIPYAVLKPMGAFGNQRLLNDELDINSYKTKCAECNKHYA
jgi:hypothetical protein